MTRVSRQEEAASPSRALARFSAPTRAWFAEAFERPTLAQEGAWEAIAEHHHALVVAPTGSGKTLAAFLWSIDAILASPPASPIERCRVLYVSPLKALAADVERNLRSPLVGIARTADRLGLEVPEVRVGVRTGDTPPAERRSLATRPPDILITTPESLFLILTSSARAGLAGIETVILDEIHVLAGSKRGAHLALSLERLDAFLPRPAQRIGLSATVRPVESVMSFLVGARTVEDGGRPVRLVQPPTTKELRIDVDVPVADLTDLSGESLTDSVSPLDLSGDASGAAPGGPGSIWPALTRHLLDLITAHRTTLVFTNGRRTAERLTARLNEEWQARSSAGEEGEEVAEGGGRPEFTLAPGGSTVWPSSIPGQSGASLGAPAVVARAHHGSMSRAERTRVEDDLKSGQLPAVVATSSLELGIDMGSIDLVVQIGAPTSVSSALQRIGRAGHQVGAVSHGTLLATHRGDLLPATIAAVKARRGEIEAVRALTNPLDVLAQQIVAMLALDDLTVTELATIVRRAAPYASLGLATLEAVLDMLAGRYPSEDFAALRARIVWDRSTGALSGRPGTQLLAATSGGTIPDRGLFGVYLATGPREDDPGAQVAERGGRRVGELDEEMVFESRVGDTFTLGTSTWRIEQITPDRVLVTPAPGIPGRLPFWKGDQPGRPAELGRALGAMVREATADGAAQLRQRIASWQVTDRLGENLEAYLRAQLEATGYLPDDTTVLVERFRDDLGDWRIVLHSPFGAAVHAPWATVLAARLRARLGTDVGVMHADDGIVLRIPDVTDPISSWDPPRPGRAGATGETDAVIDGHGARSLAVAELLLEPEDIQADVVAALGGSAHFAARFREAAARSLLLPRRHPTKRQPLWQQRQRASQLLAVASRYPDFPVVLETVRECLQDDFDTPALVDLMRQIQTGLVRVVEVETPTPSPMARSLLFHYVGTFLYDGDAPLAERRAAALTLDPTLLAELLGESVSDLADLLDPGAVHAVEAEVTRLGDRYRADTLERCADLLASHGPLTLAGVEARLIPGAAAQEWLATLVRERRAIAVRIGGVPHWSAVEDAGRLRDALGVALPPGIPEVFLEPPADPLGDLIRRHARTHAPFTLADLSARFALAPGALTPSLTQLEAAGLLTRGRLRPSDAPPLEAVEHSSPSSETNQPAGSEYCDVNVLRRIRRRSLAAARADVEAVPVQALGVFSPRWHHLGQLRGVEGLAAAVDQLAGLVLDPAELETSVLPMRVRDYSPGLLDALTAAGEVVWVGTGGPRASGMGSVVLLPADAVASLAPLPTEPGDELAGLVLEALGQGGRFFRDIVTHVGQARHARGESPVTPAAVEEALWDAVWAGLVTNDTLAPLRARLTRTATPASRQRPNSPARARRISRSALLQPISPFAPVPTARVATAPSAAGRWSLVDAREENPTARATAKAISLLERHGIVLRSLAAAEGVPGGFAALYPVLARLEETGAVRRGYLVEGQGAAQFALPECVDRLRADAQLTPGSLVLAATDPANPYGALVAWPAPCGLAGEGESVARPRRVPGADVILVDGVLTLFLERGGGSLLRFTDEPERLRRAADALTAAAPARYATVTLTRIDGDSALTSTSPVRAALLDAGFVTTPRGLRLRRSTPAGHARG